MKSLELKCSWTESNEDCEEQRDFLYLEITHFSYRFQTWIPAFPQTERSDTAKKDWNSPYLFYLEWQFMEISLENSGGKMANISRGKGGDEREN